MSLSDRMERQRGADRPESEQPQPEGAPPAAGPPGNPGAGRGLLNRVAPGALPEPEPIIEVIEEAPVLVAAAPLAPAAANRGLLNRVGDHRGPGGGGGTEGGAAASGYQRLRTEVQARLVVELRDEAETPSGDELRLKINILLETVIREQGLTIARPDRGKIIESVAQDMIGLGPLDDLLQDSSVTEIMVNNAKRIYVEQQGHMHRSTTVFENNQQLMQIIDRIVSRIGRRIDESSPMVDARLEDGSRVHIIIPPLSLTGPTITIRKFGKKALRAEDLLRFKTLTDDMMQFLRACVRARLNIAVAGGGTSGKTTTLNVLSGYISDDERIVTIEDAAELQLDQIHVVPLETRPANVEGKGAVHIRELVINSLRMRPDRIVIGECRGGEALDMLQAMNTGHDGSLTTLHANSAKEVVSRLETMVLMAGTELPSRAIREQIGAAINIIVTQSRLRDGSRKVTGITEVMGVEGDDVKMQDIFVFRQTGIAEDGTVLGSHHATGVVPFFLEHLDTYGEKLPEDMFLPRRLE